ncbi:UDP-N-acetylglucosamine pyrophosphorylase,putative [Trypanosoma brucei gambiense DAL972]|uniref:UDP-N-acetylglucosamine diphosphorylase n=1 Tax=Trypanosoma brucei gambiense (strain MHOM/CI/86/DAL972) TaxID=679716 RepID=D0A658_TRYB9|nr:UDP-N-acetylglucosamine pyrophosphorylase,putative [Trypanosoma brucei gambiense DAL972]CBH17159.1 UDP-N-acetylglucosamine pyrophosphorylase,putative [Trypanosoma brucei gambiense DAL972]|eukprot:XP_011779423.1 UDP-N-acetylglucosamine pyrophosphorylase,putative [Trypanosoma brucei gambiense DAL972]
MSDRDVCIQRLTGANQDHILTALEHGSEAERASLTAQITNELAGVDFRHFNNVLRESLEISKNCSTASLAEPPAKDSFFDISSVDRRRGQAKRIKNLEAVGYKAIQKGQIAFLILAGGSGTRLGFDKPKGFFTCDGLQQRKSLFMMHCEKIRRRQEIAESISGSGRKARVQLLVMTSGQNDAETQRFFEENSYFGLEREQVHFFAQSSVPCYDENTGRIIMENRGRICAAPGGNGAVFAALAAPRATKDKDGTLQVKESLLQHLRKLGIAYVQIGNIDNLLANVADPVFIGYAIEEEAHVVVKTCPKRGPDERVGVFVRASGKWGVVEYTEIGDRAKEIDDATGELKFNCANISSNLCSLHFMSLAAERMKSFTQYHAARKKIPTIKGPVMGIKLEAFLFDLFRFVDECDHPPKDSGAFRIMQVDRDDEFGPVKNADGAASDTPADAVRLLLSQHTRWLITALETAAMSDEQESIRGGVDVTEAKEAVAVMRSCSIKAEISPLVSVGGEALRQHLPRVIHQLLRNPPPVIFIRRDDEVVSESSNM